jgi:hypothetical protein
LLNLCLLGLEFVHSFLLLFLLLLPPRHDNSKDGVIAVWEVAHRGYSILEQRHRVPLRLEDELLLVLVVAATMVHLILHH